MTYHTVTGFDTSSRFSIWLVSTNPGVRAIYAVRVIAILSETANSPSRINDEVIWSEVSIDEVGKSLSVHMVAGLPTPTDAM